MHVVEFGAGHLFQCRRRILYYQVLEWIREASTAHVPNHVYFVQLIRRSLVSALYVEIFMMLGMLTIFAHAIDADEDEDEDEDEKVPELTDLSELSTPKR